ncbi:MAG: hypothetical protein ACREJQ_08200 [bacterium]
MAAKLPPERELLGALNSLVHFQTEYWYYVDPKRAVKLWAHYRDKVEELIAEIGDPVEFAKATERVRLTDEHLVSERFQNMRPEDFKLLDRADIPKEKWWYWLDEVKAGRLKPSLGPMTKSPKAPPLAPASVPAATPAAAPSEPNP